MTDKSYGTLYFGGFPFGNKLEASPYLIKIIENADIVAFENAETFNKLVSDYKLNIKGHLTKFGGFEGMASDATDFHENGQFGKHKYLIEKLQEGLDIIIVADEGLSAVADPGQFLASDAVNLGINVRVISGPTMAIIPYIMSGFLVGKFSFEGTLEENKKYFDELSKRESTSIFLSYPPVTIKAFPSLIESFGENRKCFAISNYDTKHEKIFRGTLKELHEKIINNDMPNYLTFAIAPSFYDKFILNIKKRLNDAENYKKGIINEKK